MWSELQAFKKLYQQFYQISHKPEIENKNARIKLDRKHKRASLKLLKHRASQSLQEVLIDLLFKLFLYLLEMLCPID